jgi:hypothetical protein
VGFNIVIFIFSEYSLVPLSFHSPSTLSPLSFGPYSDLVRVFSEEAPNEVRTRSEQETNESITKHLLVSNSKDLGQVKSARIELL